MRRLAERDEKDLKAGDQGKTLYGRRRERFHDGKIVDLSIGSVVLRLLRMKQNPAQRQISAFGRGLFDRFAAVRAGRFPRAEGKL